MLLSFNIKIALASAFFLPASLNTQKSGKNTKDPEIKSESQNTREKSVLIPILAKLNWRFFFLLAYKHLPQRMKFEVSISPRYPVTMN